MRIDSRPLISRVPLFPDPSVGRIDSRPVISPPYFDPLVQISPFACVKGVDSAPEHRELAPRKNRMRRPEV
jgi:hypothetical protein